MKKYGGLLVVLSLVTGVLLWAPRAQAAACTNVSSFGSVTLNVPELPNDDSRVLWVRWQAPAGEAALLAEVNRNECMEISAENQAPGTWFWATRQADGRPVEISFPSRQGNTLRLFGITDGLKLDRVLLTEASCVPVDRGDNCQSALALEQGSDGAPVLVSPNGAKVSGTVMLSQTPQQRSSELLELAYATNGRVLQTFDKPAPFDTSLVANGKQTISVQTTLRDGTVIRETAVIDVRNAENVLSPVVRWVRLNMRLVRIVAIAVAAVSLFSILIMVLKAWRRQSRERQFHGF